MGFFDGGPVMVLLAVLALIALGFAIAHALIRTRRTLVQAGVAVAVVLVAGALAFWRETARIDAYVENTSPEDAALIRAMAEREATLPLRLGGGAALACGAVAAIGEVVRRRRA